MVGESRSPVRFASKPLRHNGFVSVPDPFPKRGTKRVPGVSAEDETLMPQRFRVLAHPGTNPLRKAFRQHHKRNGNGNG